MNDSILVFKFGGASVKNSEAVQNAIAILNLFPKQKILIVVSAMGKTTNQLELLFNSFYKKDKGAFLSRLNELREFHVDIIDQIFINSEQGEIQSLVTSLFDHIILLYNQDTSENKSKLYDSFVSHGELLSSLILQKAILNSLNESVWTDARQLIRTDSNFQKANVDWEGTIQNINSICLPLLSTHKILVTQGFIAANNNGDTTTLGREGSDYSAGIFAHALDAKSVTIWKDVPGMLNADPKFFKDTIKLDKISFKEAIELSYYGASVIHPKTLKPLQNKGIPLYVKFFTEPLGSGTKIDVDTSNDRDIPSFIFKKNQVLFSVTPKDFSFLIEANLSDIFLKLSEVKAEINIMQNSALSFSFLIDEDKDKLKDVIEILSPTYLVKYNSNVELVTVRHYDQKTNDFVCKGKTILLQQRTRTTARFVLI
ncbi:MAG: aspartate kinase [Crocinitomicaceae bacterium]